MPLLTQPVIQLSNTDGTVAAFAKAYFYQTGTTTPVLVYENAALTVEHTWPVVADDQGLFPAIFFDPAVPMRMKAIEATGDLANPLLDIDPVNELFTVNATNIADGAIETKLGYTPVDPAAAVFTANARQNFAPTELNADDLGFRGNRINVKNTTYTFALDDSQRLIINDDTSVPNWTIPPNSAVGFPLGTYMWLRVANTGTVNLLRGVGVQLREVLVATDEDKVLPAWSFMKLIQEAENEWVLSGAA